MEGTFQGHLATALPNEEEAESLGLLKSFAPDLETDSWLLATISTDEPFFVVDLNQIKHQYTTWQHLLPTVQPFYGECSHRAAYSVSLFRW